jgi:DNA-binding transcriptional LysR family regulator
MAELDCLNDEFLLLRDGALGSVTVGYRTVSMTASIAAATAEFKATHPTLTVKLLDGQFLELMEQMRLGEVDLIISPLPEGGDKREITSCVIRKGSHVAVASRGHPMVGRETLAWADLIDQSWCLTPVGTQTRTHFEAILTEMRLPFPRNVIEANSFLMTMALMKQMPLLSILPAEVPTRLYPDVASVLPVPMFGIGDDVHLIWLNQRAMTPSVRQFRDFLIDRAAAAKAGGRLAGRGALPSRTRKAG